MGYQNFLGMDAPLAHLQRAGAPLSSHTIGRREKGAAIARSLISRGKRGRRGGKAFFTFPSPETQINNASLGYNILEFELTNQDSVGGKKSIVLTSSKQVRKGFEISQLFSPKMALNIHEKGFTISKPYQFAKSEKM